MFINIKIVLYGAPLLAGQQLICSCKCLIYYTKGFESIFYNIICIYVNVKFHNVTFFPFWSELPVIFHHGFRPSNTMGVSKQKTTEGTSEWEVSQTLLLLFFFYVKYKYELRIVIWLYKVCFIGCIYSLLTNLNWFD